MAHAQFVAAFSAIIIGLTTSILLAGKIKLWSRVITVLTAIVHVICAGWISYLFLNPEANIDPLRWEIDWFSYSEVFKFNVFFAVESWSAFLWFVLTFLAFIYEYLELTSKEFEPHGNHLSRQLLVLGATVSILSGNIVTFYFGWAVISVSGFLGIALNSPQRESNSESAFRYFLSALGPEVMFIFGVFGLFVDQGHVDFLHINEAVSKSVDKPSWAIAMIILGTLFRSFQIPFLANAKCVSVASRFSPSLYVLGHILCSSVILTKIYPIIDSASFVRYFGLIPVLTCLFSSAQIISESNANRFFGWATAYFCGSIFLSLLEGGYQAAQLQVISVAVGMFILSHAVTTMPQGSKHSRIFQSIGCLSLIGIPGTSFGTSRYLEYLSLNELANTGFSVGYVFASIKFISDVLMGIALCGRLSGRYSFSQDSYKKSERESWQRLIPLALASFLSLSIVIGARPLSGLLGEAGIDLFSGWFWFEKKVTPLLTQKSALDVLGSDTDLLARGILVLIVSLSFILSFAWIYRDSVTVDKRIESWSRAVRKVNVERFFEFLIWDILYSRATITLGKLVSTFDYKIIDSYLLQVFIKPVQSMKRLFSKFDEKIIEELFVQGFSQSVLSIGKILRFLQNGQAQFYLAFGIVMTALIFVHHIIQSGGWQ